MGQLWGGGICSECLSPGSYWRMSVWDSLFLQSGPPSGSTSSWSVSSCPFTHRTSLGAGLGFCFNPFSLGRLLISAHYQFLHNGQMCSHFPQAAAGPPHPHPGWVSSLLCPTPIRQKWNLFCLNKATSFVREGCSLPTSCTGFFQSRRCGTCTCRHCSFTQW
jgi:hypothetical protein